MLVLSRQRNEEIVLDLRSITPESLESIIRQGGLIRVIVAEIRGDKVRLGIAAPIEIPVHRLEVHDAIHEQSEWENVTRPDGERGTPC